MDSLGKRYLRGTARQTAHTGCLRCSADMQGLRGTAGSGRRIDSHALVPGARLVRLRAAEGDLRPGLGVGTSPNSGGIRSTGAAQVSEAQATNQRRLFNSKTCEFGVELPKRLKS